MSAQTLEPMFGAKSQEAMHSASCPLTSLSTLLGHLDPVKALDSSEYQGVEQRQNQLIQVRLGIASSLFLALRTKHPPTANHCLRVAMTCSSWALLMNLKEEERDELEIAALLHDIGKIGVPDHILLKSGKLTLDESRVIDRHREYAKEILSGCCASQDLLDVIYYTSAWYNGRKGEFDRSGDQLPRGARMLAIADAFDSMTTDHIYRKAIPHQRALEELFEHAGTQFDPNLVKAFDYYLRSNHKKLSDLVAQRWLHDLQPCSTRKFWSLSPSSSAEVPSLFGSLFHEHLLDSMHDGVIFVDSGLRILKWNRAMELLTGISATSAEQQLWDPATLQLRDEHFKLIPVDRCPVAQAMREGRSAHRRLLVTDSKRDKISIDAWIMPVHGTDGTICGATLLLQDASSRVSLEERLQRLNEKATQDGLTGLANRSEFDRAHQHWIEAHFERNLPYSLSISDLDFFKRINDTHGHQAGDEALIAFATLLRKHCRNGDMVARYGGEEFVMLCSDCDRAAAASRAEMIREAWSRQPHAMLNGKSLTASFGVTELQAGDTGETMLRRADRALLQAKSEGRNTVVPLGGGITVSHHEDKQPRPWRWWWQSQPVQHLLQRRVVTVVPLRLAAEKLRGFVADHTAEILEIAENRVVLEIAGKNLPMTFRNGVRPAPFLVELVLEEVIADDQRATGAELRTIVQITIRPKRRRDRRRDSADQLARQLFLSLKSYLMAQDYSEPSR
jgi:diguanylate cyclase (GGDEF)-like protein